MKLGTLLCLIMFLSACTGKNNSNLNDAVSENEDSSLDESGKYYYENTKIDFGSPIAFKSSKNIAIPIVLDEKYQDKGMPDYSYFNIAVIDTSNSIKKLVFENSVVIHNITTFEEQTNHEEDVYSYDYDEKKIIFSSDYNSLIFMVVSTFRNRKAGYKKLFVYDLDKDKLSQLSPENVDVTSWSIFNEQSKVLVRYKTDSNKNGKFDTKDDQNITIVSPKGSINSNPLFNIEKLKEIKIKVAKEN